MRLVWLRALALSLLLGSCAVSTPGVDAPRSMPAARAWLRPEYRVFYDTLSDYGQWLLIEPYGYVFRPRYDFNDWQPYSSGFWAPSDVYGWVWVSSEPHGWATYHYGRWVRDNFQGWVWIPGSEWGPSWVSWRQNDDYVGWAPLEPGGWWQPNVPDNTWLFVPSNQMGSTTPVIRSGSQLGPAVASATPVDRNIVVDGVPTPAGPAFDRIERAIGKPLPRVKLADLLPSMSPEQSSGSTTRGEEKKDLSARPVLEAVQRAGEQAAKDTKGFQTRPQQPARVPVMRASGLAKIRERLAADSTGAERSRGRR